MTEQDKLRKEMQLIEVMGLVLGAAGLYLAYRRYKMNVGK